MAGTTRSGRELERFTRDVCLAMGAEVEVADQVASHLSRSNLSGHDSHGVLRLPGYRQAMVNGELVPGARAELLSESGATAIVDAHRAFGHHSTAFAMEWAIAAARRHGVGVAAIRHSTHIGRLGEYVEAAASARMLGIATTGVIGAGGVAPFGARSRFLGTNPWAFGVPAGERPMIFDAATSTYAEGKLRVARAKGAEIPAGILNNAEGAPTTQPAAFYEGGALLPLGGNTGGHKGYGYAVASALFGGLAMIDDSEPTVAGTASLPDTPGWVGGAFVMAINPAAFGDVDSYETSAATVLQRLRDREPAVGVESVLVPGDPERSARRSRAESGVVIPRPILDELDALAAELGVTAL